MLSSWNILSVGGSIIIPKTGFDIPFLKSFRKLILDEVKQGKKFILIIGGGATCRQYQSALSQVGKVANQDLDWLGIYSTVLNAQFVRLLFGEYAHPEVITLEKDIIRTRKSIIIAGGSKPGSSTDHRAVMFAQTYNATQLINLSNIEYVYDKDPNVFPDAKKVTEIDWKTFRKDIIPAKWTPGANAPFDPVASKLAETLKLRVSILKGTNLKEVKKAIEGRKFNGTVIE